MAKALDILPLAIVPHFLINKAILHPLRKQTGGTVLVSYVCTIHMSVRTTAMYITCAIYKYFGTTTQAGKLAKDRGWAINIGGGFHHCCSNMGGRFCVYADISLCVKVIIIAA